MENNQLIKNGEFDPEEFEEEYNYQNREIETIEEFMAGMACIR